MPILSFIYKDTTRSYQSLQVFRLASTILLSILLVKMSFTQEEIGRFEWFLFLSNAASFFWSMGLKNAFMSYFPTLEIKEQKRLIFNASVLFLILGILSAGILILFHYLGKVAFEFSPLLLSLFIIFGVAVTLSEHILLVKDKAIVLFYYGLLSFAIYFIGLLLLAFQYLSIDALLFGLVVWSVLRFTFLVGLNVKYAEWTLDVKLLKVFVIFGSPLIIHVLLGGGMEYVDGFIVEYFYEKSDFTIFRYGVRELPINTIFISALTSAAIPLAVVSLKSTLEDVKKRVSNLMNWLFPISAFLMMVSPYIFEWAYSIEFLPSAKIFNIYLLILTSRILLPQIVLYARHKNTILMWVALLELVVNVMLSLYLLQFFGMFGIVYATVIAYLLQKIILVYYNSVKLGIRMEEYINVRKYLLFSIVLYLAYFCSLYINF